MKNKFALCFRPVVLETEEPDPDDHDHSSVDDVAVSKAIIVAKAQKKKNGTILPVMSPSPLDGNSGNLRVPCFPLPKTHSRKTLPGVLKTISYQTSPRMRVQNGKIHQLTLPEKTDDHVEETISPSVKGGNHDRRVKFKKAKEANISEESKIIPRNSASSSSSSSSTVSSSSDQSSKNCRSLSMKRALARSRSNSFDQKKRAKTSRPNDKTLDFSSSNSGKDKDSVFYWMVLSLLATILWGKVFAIPLASVWLYSIPYGRSGMEQRPPENKAGKLPEIETPSSREYKKKIIMEGLLERKPLQQKALNF